MTLDELYAINPLAMWAGLTVEQRESIIVPLLTCAFAEVCQDDDGTDCSDADREAAARITQDSYQSMWDAVKASFSALADDHTALHGFDTSMLDDAGKIRVRGVKGLRLLRRPSRYRESVKIGGRRVEVAGFKNIGTQETEVWEAWTQAQVDEERVRRHPEQLVGPHRPEPIPRFSSVLSPTTRPLSSMEDAYGRAA